MNQMKAKKAAQKDISKLEKTTILAYYRVQHRFPNSDAASLAKLRLACLQLPKFKHKLRKHTRDTLRELENSAIAAPMIELAIHCDLENYYSKEKDQEFIDRIKRLVRTFPKTIYKEEYIPDIKEFHRRKFHKYLAQNETFLALKFFETYREKIFPKELSSKTERAIFRAYVDSFQSEKADLYKESMLSEPMTSHDILRLAAFSLERAEKETDEKKLTKLKEIKDIVNKNALKHKWENKFSEKFKSLLTRIGIAKNNSMFFPWYYKLISKKDFMKSKRLCEMHYPILKRWMQSLDSKQVIRTHLSKIMDEYFPEQFQINNRCASSLLDLEQQAYRSLEVVYAKKWAQRLHWPKIKKVLNYTWKASEILYEGGNKKSAKKIWLYLRDKISDRYKEKKICFY